jgi:phosphatidylglycerophosphate synthase
VTAIVVTTGPLARGGPVLERLLGQLNELGVLTVHLAADAQSLAAIAQEADGEVVVLHGDIVTNTEALAGLIEDPRIANGTLETGALKIAQEQRHLIAAPDEDDLVAALTDQLESAGVALRAAPLRGMAWARPGTPEEADAAIAAAAAVDEEQIRLDSAVKPVDGFFTTFFVSSYSRYIARWAARRGLTPNQVTAFSFVIGLLSAAGFATGERWGLIAGAILLQVAFTADCVDGQLARYSRQFSAVGGWLDATFDRSKEWIVFAGLAIGADRAGHPVWVLAGAALTLQTLRHFMDFGWQEVRGQADAELGGWDRPGAVEWIKRIVAFPIGERFAVISITAAIWSAHTTFVVLLAWGGFAAVYGFAGRVLRSLKLEPRGDAVLATFRDDGPIARALAPLGRGLQPLALCAAAVAPLIAAMAIKGDGASDELALGVIGWLLIVAGVTGGRTGTSRIRWAVPLLLRFGEYAGVLWVGALAGAEPAAFALVAALALRHYDIVYGLRYRGAPVSDRLGVVMGGWDGRLALAGVLLVTDALPAGFYVLAAIIAVVFTAAAIRDWHDKEDVNG